jgi:hypothetical protein
MNSVAGRLLDISEGGAAISVDLDVSRGDRIQFWSAESTWILGETRAGVLNTATRDGEKVLHLYFVDPDLRELRQALADLRERNSDPAGPEERRPIAAASVGDANEPRRRRPAGISVDLVAHDVDAGRY